MPCWPCSEAIRFNRLCFLSPKLKILAILRRFKSSHQMQRDFMRIQSRFETCCYQVMTGTVLVKTLMGSG
jgi:hypothetical protein